MSSIYSTELLHSLWALDTTTTLFQAAFTDTDTDSVFSL